MSSTELGSTVVNAGFVLLM